MKRAYKSVKITKNGFYGHLGWGEKKTDLGYEYMADEGSIRALRVSCSIDEGTTLRHLLLNGLRGQPRLEEFIKEYTWCRCLPEIYASLERYDPDKPELLEAEYPDASCIRVFRVAEAVVDGSVGSFENYLHANVEGKADDLPYCLGTADPAIIGGLPVVFAEKCKVRYLNLSPGKHGQYPETLLETEDRITLLELLDVLIWNMGFYGGPKKVAETFNDV
jgi:hypothetical protein